MVGTTRLNTELWLGELTLRSMTRITYATHQMRGVSRKRNISGPSITAGHVCDRGGGRCGPGVYGSHQCRSLDDPDTTFTSTSERMLTYFSLASSDKIKEKKLSASSFHREMMVSKRDVLAKKSSFLWMYRFKLHRWLHWSLLLYNPEIHTMGWFLRRLNQRGNVCKACGHFISANPIWLTEAGSWTALC